MWVSHPQGLAMRDHRDMNVRTKATVLLVVWLAAYALVGGVVLFVSSALLMSTAMDDSLAITVSVGLTIGLGWLGASWAQRRVGTAIAARGALPRQ